MDIKYFDNAATTKVREGVLQAMMPYYIEQYGNPSSLYSIGRKSKKAIEKARKQVAKLINAKPEEIYFTSGGTESDNTAIKGIAEANKNKGKHIITSKIEHPAILNSCKALEKQGYKITYLDVNKDGIVDIEQLKREISMETTLISIMTANNEIGTIQPIKQIAEIAKIYGITFHTDAVQACGNIPIDVEKMGIDSLSLSGHKINAPKGIGALYIKNGTKIEKLIDGGHQEQNTRSGTENVAQIVGLGKACEIARKELKYHIDYLEEMRNYYIKKLTSQIKGTTINGSVKQRLPGNANTTIKGVSGEAILLELDEKGICISTGSACSSGSSEPSHVLKAIGLSDEDANSSIRVTFSEENTKEDIDYLVENLKQIVEELRKQN